MLKKYGISVVTHLMIGLPGEGDEELRETVCTVKAAGSDGVKIHSVYVASGTALARMYHEARYTPITMDDYVRRAVYVLTALNKETIIHRLTGDCPRELLVAPDWNLKQNDVLLAITDMMKANGYEQGCLSDSEL